MESKTSNPKRSGYRGWPVYCYVPNLIGYGRILASAIAFAVAFTDKRLFVILYLISFVCDALDGIFARMLNQTSSFGAVLDMVTDRVGTAALLVILSHVHKSCYLLFLGLLALDIFSHWLQMYSTLLDSKTSHKDIAESGNFLLRAYYKYRYFMGYCAIGAEVLYVVLYLLPNPTGKLTEAVTIASQEHPILLFVGLIAAPGFALKQLINLIQMKAAADVTIQYDVNRDKQKIGTE